MKRFLPFIAAAILVGQGCATPPPVPPPQSPEPRTSVNTSKYAFPGILPESETKKTVRMQTTKGEIVIELLPDQGPNAASNFVYLINQKFYDGLTFHRREEGFVIQGGDPEGTGEGGPGYMFADDPVKPVEQNPQIAPGPAPRYVTYKRGTVAMAKTAIPNTNGSQFFIMLDDKTLEATYSIFGRVTSGMEAVDAIKVGDRMTAVTIE